MPVVASIPGDASPPAVGVSRVGVPAVGVAALPDLQLAGVPAVGAALPAARHQLTEWARAAGLSSAQVDDLALAAYEAMANVVDHAYDVPGGVFDLHASLHDGLVTVTVSDHGQFKPAQDGASLRGRGLVLIERAAAQFELTPLPAGTRVRMSWPVPGPPGTTPPGSAG